VPAGPFLLDKEKQARIAHGFFLGRTEVTWGAYKTFCHATNHPAPLPPEFSYGMEKLDEHPVVNVTWEDARAFCKWAGGRLPTELEWLRASRFTDGRNYPWGDAWDGTKANTCDASCPEDAEYCGERLGPRRDTSVDDHFPFTAPVGSFPQGASPEGALDLCGNVWEWCQDAFKEGHKIRGGSWEMNGKKCRSDFGPWYWTAYSISIGLRIALDAP
jgi:serine/threonine-protein kinase